METILVVLGVLVTLGITVASIFGARKMVSGMLSPILAQQAETRRLLTVGVPSAARVLHIEQTGTSMAVMGEQSYEIRFHLEIQPPPVADYRGGTPGPYRAEMVALVPMLALSRIQPGGMITVRIDPQDPRKMTLDTGALMASGTPMFPGAPTAPTAYGPAPQAYGAPPGRW